MSKNTGKSSENLFQGHFDKLGKRATYDRLLDAADVRGATGRIGYTPSQPSDYILTIDGITSYAEVKSTSHKTCFPFDLLRKTQSARAAIILAAGGVYDIYLHRIPTGDWYVIPYQVVQAVKDRGRSSIPWVDLIPFLQEEF